MMENSDVFEITVCDVKKNQCEQCQCKPGRFRLVDKDQDGAVIEGPWVKLDGHSWGIAVRNTY